MKASKHEHRTSRQIQPGCFLDASVVLQEVWFDAAEPVVIYKVYLHLKVREQRPCPAATCVSERNSFVRRVHSYSNSCNHN
jgi:hypothetical protein